MACNAVYRCHCSSIVRAQEEGLDSCLGFTKRKPYLELSYLGLEDESILPGIQEESKGLWKRKMKHSSLRGP